MKKRIIKLIVAILALVTSIGFLDNPNVANAASHSIGSSYWNRNRKVRVKIRTTFRKFDALRRRYVGGRKNYRKGKVITVRAAGEFEGWVLAGTRPGSRYWWISEKKSTSWMTEYKKPRKHKRAKQVKKVNYESDYYDDGFKGNTYTSDNGSKMTFDSITTFTVYVEDYKGRRETDGKKIALLKGTFKNNGKSITPKKFILKNNISGYSGNEVNDEKNFNFARQSNPFESGNDEAEKYVDLTKSFTERVNKGDKVTFYAPIGDYDDDDSVPITDTFTFSDADNSKYTIKASENKRLVFLSYERARRLKYAPNMPDMTPPATWVN